MKPKMMFSLGLHLKGSDYPEIVYQNPPYVPFPGEIIIDRVAASGEQENPNLPRSAYRVLERRTQFMRVGGSEPQGSEDHCYIILIVEDVSQEEHLAPTTDSVQ